VPLRRKSTGSIAVQINNCILIIKMAICILGLEIEIVKPAKESTGWLENYN